MMSEFLKWLHGAGVGLLAVVAQYVGNVQVANVSNVFEIIAVAVLARLAGFIISKIPK